MASDSPPSLCPSRPDPMQHPPQLAECIQTEPEWPTLAATLIEAQRAGHNPIALLQRLWTNANWTPPNPSATYSPGTSAANVGHAPQLGVSFQ